jgi:predicted dehydrogenase
MRQRSLSRRDFLRGTAAAGAALTFPYIIPSSALGADGAVAPSNRITMGTIGCGGQGNANIDAFLGLDDCRMIAVCDVDKGHLDSTKNKIDGHYGNKDCTAYGDFRELIARKDIDAILLATPDHWHAIPAIMAAESGKDIFGEKPISHSWLEGRMMCDAVKRHARVWQTGSWQRSVTNFRQGAELVRNGYIGKVYKVEIGLPTGSPGGSTAFTAPPAELDYNFWIGPSPWGPYSKDRVHWNWRWQLDYGGGQMMDWIGHHNDIAHWGLGYDYTGPVEVEGHGNYPAEGLWNAATTYRYTATYRTGVVSTITNSGNGGILPGTKWYGDKGWVWVDRGGFQVSNPELMKLLDIPKPISLFRSPGHHRNFLDCVKSRRSTITPAEVAHRSASVGHLGQVAMILGRKIRWNPDTEEVIGDEIASRMLRPAMRDPWQL